MILKAGNRSMLPPVEGGAFLMEWIYWHVSLPVLVILMM